MSRESACGAVVEFAPATATDNCPGVTVAQTGGLASGETFPVGTTTVTFTATDSAGNTAACAFDVTVRDAEAPVITLNGLMTVSIALNGTYEEQGATVTDNCDESEILESLFGRFKNLESDQRHSGLTSLLLALPATGRQAEPATRR